jgi:hypothetical protein
MSRELGEPIRWIATEHLGWGAPGILGELLKLDIQICERTVSRLMPRRRRSPSLTWRPFLANNGNTLASVRSRWTKSGARSSPAEDSQATFDQANVDLDARPAKGVAPLSK